MTAGAISRQIRQLEADLGVPLFERRNRRVRLTAAGQTLLGATTDALNRVRDAVSTLRSVDAPVPLVVRAYIDATLAHPAIAAAHGPLPAFAHSRPGCRRSGAI